MEERAKVANRDESVFPCTSSSLRFSRKVITRDRGRRSCVRVCPCDPVTPCARYRKQLAFLLAFIYLPLYLGGSNLSSVRLIRQVWFSCRFPRAIDMKTKSSLFTFSLKDPKCVTISVTLIIHCCRHVKFSYARMYKWIDYFLYYPCKF